MGHVVAIALLIPPACLPALGKGFLCRLDDNVDLIVHGLHCGLLWIISNPTKAMLVISEGWFLLFVY